MQSRNLTRQTFSISSSSGSFKGSAQATLMFWCFPKTSFFWSFLYANWASLLVSSSRNAKPRLRSILLGSTITVTLSILSIPISCNSLTTCSKKKKSLFRCTNLALKIYRMKPTVKKSYIFILPVFVNITKKYRVVALNRCCSTLLSANLWFNKQIKKSSYFKIMMTKLISSI